VTLSVRASTDRVLIEVHDECGGLPGEGEGKELIASFEQRGADRTGLGIGLTFSRWGAEANGGRLYARNLPGKGCVFTLDLPRLSGAGDRTPLAPIRDAERSAKESLDLQQPRTNHTAAVAVAAFAVGATSASAMRSRVGELLRAERGDGIDRVGSPHGPVSSQQGDRQQHRRPTTIGKTPPAPDVRPSSRPGACSRTRPAGRGRTPVSTSRSACFSIMRTTSPRVGPRAPSASRSLFVRRATV
jgi:hypothetical protein